MVHVGREASRRRPRRAGAEPARRGAAGRGHRRRQRRGARGQRQRPGPLGVVRPVVVAGNVDAAGRGRGAARAVRDAVRRWPTTWSRGSACCAPDSARARDPGDVPAARDRRQAPVVARADFTAMVRGATPDVVLTAVELLARGLDAEHPGPVTSSWSTSGAPPPTSTRSSRSTPRTPAWPARWSRRSGEPHRRGRPRDAVERGAHGRRGGGRRILADGPRLRAAAETRHADPAFLPTGRRRGDVDEQVATAAVGVAAAPARRPAAGGLRSRRPGRRAQRQGPARGRPARRVRRGAARTTPAWPRGCSGRHRRATSRAAGSCPGVPARSSTTTTCWPPAGPARAEHRPLAAHALLARLRPDPS